MFTLNQLSEQWPGTVPPDAPTETVTYVSMICSNWRTGRQYAAIFGVYRAQLVKPSNDRRYWYLDFKQPHELVSVFTCWHRQGPDLLGVARMHETPDAPAFAFQSE